MTTARTLARQLTTSEQTAALYTTLRAEILNRLTTVDPASLTAEILNREAERYADLVDEYEDDAEDLRDRCIAAGLGPDDIEGLTLDPFRNALRQWIADTTTTTEGTPQ